ncbi:MAG: STAS/SEC14 domain-containing protein [Rubripirellula sp.]
MITEITGLPDGTLGFSFSGQITGDDYDGVLTPTIERAIEQHERIKIVMEFGSEFEGYSLGAAWDDTKMGLRHWNGFERIAVATDVGWLRTSIRAMSLLMPCPVQLFDLNQLDDARRWLGESLGAIHVEPKGDVIAVRLLGKLEPSAYDGVDDDISNLMSHSSNVRLVIDLREFDGWSGLAALGDHLSLIREHRRTPQRVAVVGDKSWQRLAEKILSKFVNAETRFFDSPDYDQGESWVAA